MLGRRAWDAAGKIRLAIGPLALPEYLALLPGSDAYRRLSYLVSFYLREDLDVDVELILAAPPDPDDASAQLAQLGHGRLKRTAWLGRADPCQLRRTQFGLVRWTRHTA